MSIRNGVKLNIRLSRAVGKWAMAISPLYPPRPRMNWLSRILMRVAFLLDPELDQARRNLVHKAREEHAFGETDPAFIRILKSSLYQLEIQGRPLGDPISWMALNDYLRRIGVGMGSVDWLAAINGIEIGAGRQRIRFGRLD